jgi:GAF domain-containing protein
MQQQSLEPMAMTAAVRGALADPGPDAARLLTSTVRTARAVFAAAAGSILLFDEQTRELVFEAVSGEGEEFLVGTRFPADLGLAGWTLVSGEPMAVDDLAENQVFARDVARSTGYVPSSLMVVPLLDDGDVLGVLEVLDPRSRSGSCIADLDLLMMIADQAALGLSSLARGRTARAALAAGGAQYEPLAALVRLLTTGRPEQHVAVLRLIDTLNEVLSGLVTADGTGR